MNGKFMKLLGAVPCESTCEGQPASCPDRKNGCCSMVDKLDYCAIVHLAEHLIANGAVVPVRCGKCAHWVPDDHRRTYGTCFKHGFQHGIRKHADGFCDSGTPRKKG